MSLYRVMLRSEEAPADTLYEDESLWHPEAIHDFRIAIRTLGNAIYSVLSTDHDVPTDVPGEYSNYTCAAVQVQKEENDPWVDEVVVEIQRQHT